VSRLGRGGNQSENDFLKNVGVLLIGAITWFALSTAGELIGSQATATLVGQQVGRYLLLVAIVVTPLAALTWTSITVWRWRHPPPSEPEPQPEPQPPVVPEPSSWHTPDPIYDRAAEVDDAVRAVRDSGIAVVCGARDVGTSAVAEAAVQRLIDHGLVERRHVARFDLRSRSSRSPDDARATAARMLSAFGEDEPANGTAKVLDNAAERLHDRLAKQYAVLMLDNVAVPDEIAWLTRQWTARNNRQPWLVIAGEAAIGPVVPNSRVPVAPLSTDGMRQLWHAETDTAPQPPVSQRRWPLPRRVSDGLLRWRHRSAGPAPAAEPLDRLLTACGGRPRAIKAVARETSGPHREAEVNSLLESLNSDENNPLVRIWRAILLRAEGSLSPDAVWMLHALAVLPVTALTREAVNALVAANPAVSNGSSAEGGLPASFEELRVRDFVQEVDERYRLPMEIRWAVTGQAAGKDAEIARVAVPALVRHHAERVEGQANRLDVPTAGARATWRLHDEERTLRPLFSTEYYSEDDSLLLAVIDDLARIASALEYWYVREQQAAGLLTVSTALGQLAGQAERPGLTALAAARKATAYRMIGQRAKAEELLTLVAGEAHSSADHELGAELAVRLQVEKALLGMADTGSEVDSAERARLWRSLEDIAKQQRHPGAGIAMINLGALHIAENSPDKALVYLRKAEAMARDRHDVGCLAQSVELQGIALSGTDLHEAVPLWQRAQQQFEAIGEEQGQARCLQHLGAAALVDPTVAGRLTTGTRVALAPRAAAEQAMPLLAKSKQLRAGQPDTELIDEYLREATRRMAPPRDEDFAAVVTHDAGPGQS
jgi:tetratricopeptide (TPR) repeat protein